MAADVRAAWSPFRGLVSVSLQRSQCVKSTWVCLRCDHLWTTCRSSCGCPSSSCSSLSGCHSGSCLRLTQWTKWSLDGYHLRSRRLLHRRSRLCLGSDSLVHNDLSFRSRSRASCGGIGSDSVQSRDSRSIALWSHRRCCRSHLLRLSKTKANLGSDESLWKCAVREEHSCHRLDLVPLPCLE